MAVGGASEERAGEGTRPSPGGRRLSPPRTPLRPLGRGRPCVLGTRVWPGGCEDGRGLGQGAASPRSGGCFSGGSAVPGSTAEAEPAREEPGGAWASPSNLRAARAVAGAAGSMSRRRSAPPPRAPSRVRRDVGGALWGPTRFSAGPGEAHAPRLLCPRASQEEGRCSTPVRTSQPPRSGNVLKAAWLESGRVRIQAQHSAHLGHLVTEGSGQRAPRALLRAGAGARASRVASSHQSGWKAGGTGHNDTHAAQGGDAGMRVRDAEREGPGMPPGAGRPDGAPAQTLPAHSGACRCFGRGVQYGRRAPGLLSVPGTCPGLGPTMPGNEHVAVTQEGLSKGLSSECT